MLRIKKTIGKKKREVTLEDVYNKLSFLSMAVVDILKDPAREPVLHDNELCGLQNLQWDTLEELRGMMDGK
ncbi:MAG: hypothetical protein HZB79_06220 [Deltaproteobacteria bacterium]|nr:hypothetical protein [Deltaproteobacteria bacterium]